jgi:hypothetical protein
MRAFLLVACFLPSVAVASSTRNGRSMTRPTSYVVTLIRESRPGQVHDPNLQFYPPYPLYPGRSRLAATVWWKQGRWREVDRWLTAPPAHTGSFASLTTVPLPNVSASDGHRIWIQDPHQRTVTVSSPDPAGTWPATEASLKQFTGWRTLSAILRPPEHYTGVHCVTPIRHADSRIAGRPVYVLELGQDRCRYPRGGHYANQSRLLDGRLIVWIDQQSLFTLRADQYAFNSPNRLMLRWYVTSIRYNMRLPASLFHLTVPPGYRLVRSR